jgi:signal transduction histidine kinase
LPINIFEATPQRAEFGVTVLKNLPSKIISLNKKLLLLVLACSSIGAAVTTVGQIAYEYYNENGTLKNDIQMLENGLIQGLKRDLWNFDDTAMQDKIDSALQIKSLTAIEVLDKNEKKVAGGKKPDDGTDAFSDGAIFNLKTEQGELFGKVKVSYTRRYIVENLQDRVLVILALNAAKTAIVSGVLLFLLGALLVRPIQSLAMPFMTMNIDDPLLIQKLNEVVLWRGRDELHDLRTSITDSLKKLINALEEIKKKNTEIQVEQEKSTQITRMAELGMIASGMAHEINNPLAIIRGFADLLTNKTIPAPLMESYAAKIKLSADRIGRIVKSLQHLAQEENLEPFAEISATTILATTRTIFETTPRNKDIKLHFQVVDPSVKILCRPGRLEQVLISLINNAYDAVSGQEERWVNVGFLATPNGRALFSVKDSGTRIPNEIATKMFMPFFTTKEIGKGTGLGLSISMALIESQSGHLTYDETAENTQFLVDMPIAS